MPRDPERWRRIEDLFEQALDLPAEARPAFLSAVCGADEELLRELDSLLEADRSPGLLDTFEPFPPGACVGAYRIVGEIGRGGMATVYEARRDDETFDRRVALKMIRATAGLEDLRRRFRQERQILAGLEHPGIARLYDGGTTEDGRPYLVLELVEGEPIDRACNHRALDLRQRLELLVEVCAAVAHAHRRLVIHRDLKPSNILVTPEGRTKLLDFGIARLLDPDGGARAATRTAARALTPDYASPEQLLGGPMTTATDVYSLGVLLYQLLTGRLPHEDTELAELLMAEGRAAVARPPHLAVESGDPGLRPPGPARILRRQLAGDLDAILLRALEPSPGRRYPSVEALGEDLERFLGGLPVKARRGSWAYRSGRFLRRHAAATLAVVAAFTALAGFSYATVRQAERLERERDRVTLERNKAQQVTSFLLGVFEAADPWQEADASSITARELLDRGADRLDQNLAAQPAVQAAARLVIGRVYRNLGLYESAKAQLEAVLETRRLGAEPVDLAEGLQELGMLELGRGDLARAESLLGEALDLRVRHLGEAHPDSTATRAELAVTMLYAGRLEEAEALQRRVLAERLAQHGADHEEVALALHNLGGVLNRQHRPEEAEPLLRQALAIRRKKWQGPHTMIAANLSTLASTVHAKGDLEAAVTLFQEAVDQSTQILGPNHPWGSITRQRLGTVLLELGRAEEAEPLLRAALAARRRNMAAGTPWIASAAGSLGACLVTLRRFEEAEELLLESHASFAKEPGEGAEATEQALDALAAALRAAGRGSDADHLEMQRARPVASPDG